VDNPARKPSDWGLFVDRAGGSNIDRDNPSLWEHGSVHAQHHDRPSYALRGRSILVVED